MYYPRGPKKASRRSCSFCDKNHVISEEDTGRKHSCFCSEECEEERSLLIRLLKKLGPSVFPPGDNGEGSV